MWEIFQSARLRRLFLAETVLLFLVAVLCVRLRIGAGYPGLPPNVELWAYWREALLAGVAIPVAVQLAMYYLGLYADTQPGSRTQLLVRIQLAHLVAGVALALLFYLFPHLRLQRLALLLSLGIGQWLLFSLRCHFEEILLSGSWRRRVLILGTGGLAQQIGRWLLSRPGAGYELAGFLSPQEPEMAQTLVGRPVLGSYGEISEAIQRHNITDVVFSPDNPRGDEALMNRLLAVKLTGTEVWSALSFTAELTHSLPIELLHPADVVFDAGFTPSKWTVALKRGNDVVLSLVALILVSPILLIVAILIRLDSSGPALYKQPRVGLRGRLFTIYKFRSMKVSNPGEPMRLTSHNDDRVTRVGRFIRLHRIDELPQFFNVLLGDMSLVGPRPEVESSVKELRVSLPFYDQRHAIRPGITSLGQVRFGAATTLSEARERLKYDLYYQKNMSLAFDLSILIDTVKVVLLKIGAR